MKIEVKETWRQAELYIVSVEVNGKKLTYEGGQIDCEQIAKDLRSRINRSGKKTSKKVLTAIPAY